MDYLPDWFFWLSVLLFGLVIGSFLNVVIFRLPREQSVVFPNSRCPSCEAPIKAYDNIPVVSYLVLGGKCRACKARISPVYPTVELLTGCLFLIVYLRDGRSIALGGDLLFVALIVPLVFIDLEHQLLPNLITYPGTVLMLIMRQLDPGLVVDTFPSRLLGLSGAPDWALGLGGSALGALAGAGTLWLVREAYFRLRKVEGMGLGDVKMMFMVGVYIGWQLTLLTIFLASLLGTIVGVIVMAMRGGTMKMKIPFGVFLGPAAILALLAGRELITWYVGLTR
jgi:leader peptidase (prepilin peptidase)/N-methyltransferase